ncbi:hypothetical protein H4P12_03270 [Paracoccus sp. 11-3]|uniref:Uncharacterized protein n=1 Tax=Paracoccus amoyensis TaxID=2760093 RepID=A0A926J518_9RHOB|nr:hypothetical protein [Paracoccus amoyensis]MBC9245752.1 hypothetical protein [Paracoccus amoyensis]
MTTGKFITSGAILALIAGLGGAVSAQTEPTAGQTLPAPLAALNLTDLQIDTKRDGIRKIEGMTAEGVKIEAQLDMAGNVIELEADDGVLPQSLIDAYLPQAARDHAFMGSFAQIEEINILPDLIVVSGNQENGDDIEAAFDKENKLVKAEFDDAALPASVIEEMVPQSVREGDIFAQFAIVEEVGQRRDILIVKGDDADGKGMGAAFDQDGRVLRFGREGDRPRGPRFGDDGPRGDDRGGWGRHGPGDHGPDGHRGDKHGRNGHGPRGDDQRGDGSRDDGPRDNDEARMVPAQPSFDAVAVNKTLTEAGYSNFGFLRPQGNSVVIEATNPQGENVLLELGADGDVVRETAR